jgi:Zn finger protein HypA/HybF involved in hydrogenase expression
MIGSIPLDSLTLKGYSSTDTKKGVIQVQAYCFKCRRKVEIRNPQKVTLKNSRPATKGICPSCGTKVFRIGQG